MNKKIFVDIMHLVQIQFSLGRETDNYVICCIMFWLFGERSECDNDFSKTQNGDE